MAQDAESMNEKDCKYSVSHIKKTKADYWAREQRKWWSSAARGILKVIRTAVIVNHPLSERNR
jgi:hypothetical protein